MLLKTIILTSLSFSSFAFAQTNIQQRLLDTTRRVSDIVHRDINYIDAERARMATAKLQEVEQILQGNGGGGGGRPDPYPGNPSYPPSTPAQFISARLGSVSFNLNASTTNQVFQHCVAATRTQARADVAEVSINYGTTLRANTPGWWAGAGEGCAQIAQLLIGAGFPSDFSQMSFAGSIAGVTFQFQGNSIVEIGAQCENFVRSQGLNRVDRIVVTDFRVLRTLTTPSWWTTSFEICQQVVNMR